MLIIKALVEIAARTVEWHLQCAQLRQLNSWANFLLNFKEHKGYVS